MNQNLKLLFPILCGLFLLTSLLWESPTAAQYDQPLPDGVQIIPFDIDQLQQTQPAGTTSVPELAHLASGEAQIDLSEFSEEQEIADVSNFSYRYFRDRADVDSNEELIYQSAQPLDFNNDGLMDMLYYGNGIQGPVLKIYKQTLEGGLAGPQKINVGFDEWAIGDLDNNGFTDIVHIENDPFFVGFSIRYQQTDGTFTFSQVPMSETLSALIWRMDRMLLIDANGDSFRDVVMLLDRGDSQGTKTWYALMNDGEGGFDTPEIELNDFQIFYSPKLFEVKNIDTDEPEEILMGHTFVGGAEIKIGEFVSNTFQQTATLTATIDGLRENNDRRNIDIGDMNGDGIDDIILMLSQLSETWVYIWTQNEDGSFNEPVALNSPHFVDELTVGDVNQDDTLDILLLSSSTLVMLEMREGLTIQKELVDSWYTNKTTPFYLDDFNSDGFPDLISGDLLYFHSTLVNQIYMANVFNVFVNYRYFFDDFSDPNSGWFILNNADIELRYLDEEYSIVNRNSDFLGFSTAPIPANNYSLRTDIRKAGQAEGGFGIFVESDQNSAYFMALVVFPDYGVAWLIDVDENNKLRLVDRRQVIEVPDSNASYRFEADRRAFWNRLNLSFDVIRNSGEPAFSASFDLTPIDFGDNLPHRVGFITLPLEDGFDARFDDFEFSPFD